MVSRQVHRVIVVDVDRQPIGIVSSMDVMRGISACRTPMPLAAAHAVPGRD
jgi:predicted transcriptional regulator